MSVAPASLKLHNWALYEQSMSPDPSISCQFVGKLIASLITTMKICDVHEYDAMLAYEMLGARRAWKEYNDGSPGSGMQTVTEVLSKIGHILYNEDYATASTKAFTGR